MQRLCEACPPGSVRANHLGSSFSDYENCTLCEPGTVANRSGLSSCWSAPIGYSTGGKRGASALTYCGDEDLMYSSARGSPSCETCPCNKKNSKKCDPTTGDCTCISGLFFPNNNNLVDQVAPGEKWCSEEQDLVASNIIACLTLVFNCFATFVLFFQGNIANLSEAVRKLVTMPFVKVR